MKFFLYLNQIVKYCLSKNFNYSLWLDCFCVKNYIDKIGKNRQIKIIGKIKNNKEMLLHNDNIIFEDQLSYSSVKYNIIFLDPRTSFKVLKNKKVLSKLSLNTPHWALFPIFSHFKSVELLYSDEFSYKEIREDQNEWRWAISQNEATVKIINTNSSGMYFLNISLTSVHEGYFILSFGKYKKKIKSKDAKNIKIKSYFPYGLSKNSLKIKFTGTPFIPDNPNETRKTLFYGLHNVSLTNIYDETQKHEGNSLHDSFIREVLHENGFYEVNIIDTSSDNNQGAIGLISYFDYISKFSTNYYPYLKYPKIFNKTNTFKSVSWYLASKIPIFKYRKD